ncbi:MAG TPA: GNAT family N-acetyltransferase [Pyrinomonadaceae bacterium]|nr:GNAT family N-acetyltransferase [Pyrinomonadaceae bacterium]
MTKPALSRIDDATEKDVALILQFIRELAEYERGADRVSATEEVLRSTLFGGEQNAHAVIAYRGPEPVAFAIYFFSYSSFSGLPNLYLEDIFVRPAYRGLGLGKELFAFLARRAAERGCGRMEWSVLNWNESAIAFYRKLGAEPVTDWTVFHLAKDRLDELNEPGFQPTA